MGEIVKRQKAMSVKPLKSSQPIGACLAVLGIQGSIPLLHGSQGCTAFGKIFLIQHFREPIPLQTTAMDQVTTIMGADENVVEALKTLAEKAKPHLIGLITTALSETQGADIQRNINEFRTAHPDYHALKIIPIKAPDFVGSFESGFALAVTALIEHLVPQTQWTPTTSRQINILVPAFLTPGDIEFLKETLETFDLDPVVIPDISDSLDGHLTTLDFCPTSIGGSPVSIFEKLGQAKATLVIGHALTKAADLLYQRTGVPDYRFNSLMGLQAFDQLLMTLQTLADRPIPLKFARQRAQLQDTLLDTHFMLSHAQVALALDPDDLYSFSQLLKEVGAEIVVAVTSTHSPILEKIPASQIKIGDLEDLEDRCQLQSPQLLISNSHAVESADALGIPLLRAGFPQFDLIGGYQRTWIGYKGTRQTLFDLANLIESHQHALPPYYSMYGQKIESHFKEAAYATAQTFAAHPR